MAPFLVNANSSKLNLGPGTPNVTDHHMIDELDLEWIRPVVAGIRRPQGCSKSSDYARGHPHVPRWTNDHDVAHLQAKTVPVNLKSAWWL